MIVNEDFHGITVRNRLAATTHSASGQVHTADIDQSPGQPARENFAVYGQELVKAQSRRIFSYGEAIYSWAGGVVRVVHDTRANRLNRCRHPDDATVKKG